MIFCTAWNITVLSRDPRWCLYVTPRSAAVVWVSVGVRTCTVMMDVNDMIKRNEHNNHIYRLRLRQECEGVLGNIFAGDFHVWTCYKSDQEHVGHISPKNEK